MQHNCKRAGCWLERIRTETVERQTSTNRSLELNHAENNQYIINLASISSSAFHWRCSDVCFDPIAPLDWVNALHDGMGKWGSTTKKKKTKAEKKNLKASTSGKKTTRDPDLL